MSVRLVIGDRSGRIIAELEPGYTGPVSWRLNNIGRVQFQLSTKDPKVTEDNLRFGNRCLLQFDNGLPDWGGLIDPPRAWSAGLVQATAYSAEHLLTFHSTEKGRYFSGVTVGTIFSNLILESGADILIGHVWNGGGAHSPEYHIKDLFTIIRDSLCRRMESADFDVTASEENGYIVFTTNLYERMGKDNTGVVLLEDHNLTAIKLDEQGTIINSFDLAGAGTGWGAERITSHSEDADSIAAYGRRQKGIVYGDVSIQATLDAHADNHLDESKDPHDIWDLEAADKAPALFAKYGLGDTVRLIAPSYGFGGTETNVRILAREFDPETGFCKLVTREVTE